MVGRVPPPLLSWMSFAGGWGSRDDVVVLLVKGAKIGTTTTQFDIVVLSFCPRDVVSFVRG